VGVSPETKKEDAAMTVEVHRKVVVLAPVEEVWRQVGDFGAINGWHPAIATCDVERNGPAIYRHLRTHDGGEFLEREVAEHNEETDHSYAYEIVSSPLPVSNYQSVFRVVPDDAGARVEWSSHFEADGATEQEAARVVAGIYEAGLENIKQQFG
jgi:carbon monoxide dehydrogenase subunit G